MSLAKFLEQGVDNRLRRGRDAKQPSLHIGRDRDYGGVGEGHELFVAAQRRKQRARRAEAEHDSPSWPATGRDYDDSPFYDEEGGWRKVVDVLNGADTKHATRTA